MDIGSVVGVLAVFALVAINGFFVAAEFALVKIRATRVEQLVLEGNAIARVLQRQTSHLDSYIAATQLGITLASLALGWIGEPSLAHLIEPLFSWIGNASTAEGIATSIAVAISFVLITGFHIVLGELVPKSIALQRTERVSLFIAVPLLVFARVFRPFIVLMNGLGNSIVRLLGLSTGGEHEAVHTVEELEIIVAQSRKAGILDPEEEVLLRHVFDFGDKTAGDILTPRSDIVAVAQNTPLDEAARISYTSGYTRLPVYRETLDQIIGVLHAKDLLHAREEASISGTAPGIESLMRPASFALETQHLDEVLTTFRREGAHMAMVIDEYGQVAGLITLEDVLEELVGEIHDEYDVGEDVPIRQQQEGVWTVAGTESYENVRATIGLPEIPKKEHGQYGTLAGLLMLRLGRLPRIGDRVRLDHNWEIEVTSMEGHRTRRVLVRRVTAA
ncbi:MAG TPA: hemolysin family protein [Ktedonobacterales bacterium]